MSNLMNRIERMMQVAKDTKKEFSYNKCAGKWSWHDDEEFDTFLECLEDAVYPYFDVMPYDGTFCPVCHSDRINGGDVEPFGATMFFRSCNCDSCDASWTEEAMVVGCDHIASNRIAHNAE